MPKIYGFDGAYFEIISHQENPSPLNAKIIAI